MNHMICLEGQPQLTMRPLAREDIPSTLALCDSCVGKNLYTYEELSFAIDARDRFFYLFTTPDGETAGYIYFYLTTVEGLASYAKLSQRVLLSVSQATGSVGKIQSVGVKDSFRRCGLARKMVDAALAVLSSLAVSTVFVVCWKPGQTVPLQRTMEECRFIHLTTAKKIWYDDPDLICPYCSGRCQCDAEVYYKTLDKGGAYEA